MTHVILEYANDGHVIGVLATHPTSHEADQAASAFRAEGRNVDVRPVQDRQPVLGIQNPGQLLAFAQQYRLRQDWHEPDEQGINARLIGTHLDNAMGSSMRPIGDDNESGEFNIVLTWQDEDASARDVAVINLATLLSWATDFARMELARER